MDDQPASSSSSSININCDDEPTNTLGLTGVGDWRTFGEGRGTNNDLSRRQGRILGIVS